MKNWRRRELTEATNPEYLLDLLETVREKTTQYKLVNGVYNSPAIQDCWDEIIERIEKIAQSEELTKSLNERYAFQDSFY